MTYLNQEIKDQIVINALAKAGIPERHKKLEKAYQVWAEAVRLDAVGGTHFDRKLKTLEKRVEAVRTQLGKGLISRDPVNQEYSIYLNIEGRRFHAPFSGKVERELTSQRIYKNCPHSHTLKPGNPLVKQFLLLEKTRDQIKKDRQLIQSAIRPVLENIRTLKKLLETWPEVKALLPKNIGAPQTTALAVPLAEINKKIGLTK